MSQWLRWKYLIAALCAAVALLFALRAGYELTTHDYNRSHEGYCLYSALNFSRGLPIYAARDAVPYHVYVLSPLHAWISGLTMSLPLPSLHAKVVAVRSLSFFALCLCFWLLWTQVLRLRKVPPWLAGLVLILSLSKFVDYMTTGRNDTFSLLAEAATVFFFLKWLKREKREWLMAAISASVVSFYTRQTGVAAVTSIVLWLLLRRRWKTAATVAGGWGVLSASLFGILNSTTHGAFFDHLILSNLRSHVPAAFHGQFPSLSSIVFWLSHALLFISCFAALRRPRSLNHADQFLALTFCVAFALGLFLLPRPGGDVNYLFEAIYWAIPFACLSFQKWIGNARTRNWILAAVTAQLLFIAVATSIKMQNAARRADFDFPAATRWLQENYPGYGFIVGGVLGDSLIMHTFLWSYHGPDVSNFPAVAECARPHFDWVFEKVRDDIQKKTINTLVMAHPGCRQFGDRFHWRPELYGLAFEGFRLHSDFEGWVCTYTRK